MSCAVKLYIKFLQDSFFDPTKKSEPLYTRVITPKRVTSGGAHLRGLAPRQHSFEETSHRWRRCVRFDRPGNRTRDSCTDSDVLTTELIGWAFLTLFHFLTHFVGAELALSE